MARVQKTGSNVAHDPAAASCGCPGCAGGVIGGEPTVLSRLDAVAPDSADFKPVLLEDAMGGSYRGKRILDKDDVIEQIDSGRSIAVQNGVITYSFLDGPTTIGVYNNPNFGFRQPDGYSPMSEAQKAVAREGMELWDDLIAPEIVEMNGNGADIILANTTTGPAQAAAYYPGNGMKYQGDIWVATPEVNWTNNWLGFNGYGWTTIVHEQGHALGLSHPGNYNFSANFTATYVSAAEYAQDSLQYSIMSYWSSSETGAQTVDVAVGLFNYAQTPMIHDILAIQSKYGADLTTRAGDTEYGFGSDAGRSVYDFSQNLAPNLAIYDAGGTDTLDLSGANAGVFIDLRDGAFSSMAVRPTLTQANAATAAFNAATDAAQGDFAPWTEASLNNYLDASGIARATNIYNATGVTGVMALSYSNVSIAYDTVIENATGGSERDYLAGNDGVNTLVGLGGDDVLSGRLGDDILDGGAGQDSVSYASATAAVNVNLSNSGPHSTIEGSDTFVSIEGLIGSDFHDTLTGDGGDNILNGGLGNDTLDGGAGNDILSFMGAQTTGVQLSDGTFAGVNVTLSSTGTGVVTTTAGTDSYSGFEGLAGGFFSDTLTGNAGANILKGDFGNDSLSGGAGDDSLYGEVGNDLLFGGDGLDMLSGGLGNDQLQGQAGDDRLYGDKGNDLLLGGLGHDLLNGGEGTDTANWQLSATGITASLVTGLATGEGTDTLEGIENLTGSNQVDVLTGDGNANVLNGFLGSDTLDGGGGIDTASFSVTGGPAVNVNLQTGVATGQGTDTLISIENVTGSSLGDVIVGSNGDNLLNGGGGADNINGGNGDDTLIGGTGNDVLAGGNGTGDTLSFASFVTFVSGGVTFNAYDGTTTGVTVNLLTGAASSSEGNDTLSGFENIVGTAINDTLTGNDDNNVIEGGAGNDVLDGGKGNDRLDGGAGADIVSYAAAAAGVAVSLADASTHNSNMGNDTLISIEGLIGSAFNDTLTGDGLSNSLSGGAGNDTITAGGGNDLLSGGLGDDVIAGGTGTDSLSYAASLTGVTVNLVNGTATGEGSDTLSEIENVTGSAQIDSLTGSAGANSLSGGAGDDTISGGDGNDTIAGGLGNDILDGGNGTDTLSYSGSATAVNINLLTGSATGEGTDTISNFENVTGSSGNDTLTGNAGANVLNGGGGVDTLNGGAGIDELFGGSGNDIFQIIDLGSVDKILDFAAGDKIDLSAIDANEILDNDQGFTFINDAAFNGTAGQLRYEGNLLSGDTDGDGVADFSVMVTNFYTLQTTDFIL